MGQMIRIVVCFAVFLLPNALAQSIEQIQLTEKQIVGFISAQQDMEAITKQMEESSSDKPDPKIQVALENAAKRHGFVDFSEYDDVAENIALIMAGIDPVTKTFAEPEAAIKKEIQEVTADKSMPDGEKQQALAELKEALKTARPVVYADNITLVTKYFDRIQAVLNYPIA